VCELPLLAVDAAFGVSIKTARSFDHVVAYTRGKEKMRGAEGPHSYYKQSHSASHSEDGNGNGPRSKLDETALGVRRRRRRNH
jgi:hypothetical protein